jgi:hypothetical protein
MSRLRPLLAGVLVAPLLVACSAVSLQPVSPTSSATTGDSRWLTSRLTTAVADDDEATFDASFSGQEDAGIRGWIWTNLRLLHNVDFSTDSTGVLIASWQADLDSLPIKSQVGTIACVTPSTCQVTDLGPQPGVSAPIWVVQPLQSVKQGQVQVLAPVGDDAVAGWLDAALTAQKTLSSLSLGSLEDFWDGNVVVELPGNANAFAQRFGGTSPAGYVTIGAMTQLQAKFRDPGQSQVAWTKFSAHIVVNPMTTGGLTKDERVFLLTHEMVHVATSAWPIAAGAMWVSEGLAEDVAMDAVPGEGAKDWTQAKAACTATGLAVPSDSDYGSNDAQLQTATYSIGGAIVGLLRQHLGATSNDALLALRQGQPVAGLDLATWTRDWCRASS